MVAVVLLAGAVVAQQSLHLLGRNNTATAGATAQRPPQRPSTPGAGSSAGVQQSLDIKKTVWYGGRKFTLDTARYGAGKLQVEVSVENLSAKDDDLVWNIPVYFAADGRFILPSLWLLFGLD